MVQRCHFQKVRIFSALLCLVVSVSCTDKCNIKEVKSTDDDIEIDPFHIIEEGCPLVLERYGLNLGKLNGTWKLPFVSMNWMAEIGIFLKNKQKIGHINLKNITSICVDVKLSHKMDTINGSTTDYYWNFNITGPGLKGEIEMDCFTQHNRTRSKFVCITLNDDRDQYMMVAGTDHASWLLLVRCVPGEPGLPSKGMSWAILSKKEQLDPGVRSVLFSVLEGYGFDVDEFKVQLPYKNCKP